VRTKLTKARILTVEPGPSDVLLWDSECPGLHLKITPTGSRLWLYYYRLDGRQRRPKIGSWPTLTVEAARTVAQQWAAQVALGRDPSGERKRAKAVGTVAQLCDRYLIEHAEKHKKATSVREDRKTIDRHIKPALGSLNALAVKRDDVAALVARIGKDAPVAANRTRALLHTIFNLAERWGIRPDGSNPVRHVERFAEVSRERYLSPAEAARFGAALRRTSATSTAMAVRLLLFTGCRKGEILSLRWADVDLAQGILRLADSKVGAREVVLNTQAKAILSTAERRGPFVLPGKGARHLAELHISDLLEAAKVENFRPHDMRHHFATVGAACGIRLEVIGELLGHGNSSITAVYAHQQRETLREAAQKIGDAIEAALAKEEGK